MIDKIVGIYGASGFGKEVVPLVRATQDYRKEQICFIDDRSELTSVQGYKVYSYEEFASIQATEKKFVIAIADSKIRQTLTEKLLKDGFHHLNITASNSVVMEDVSIGEGFLLCPFVTLTSAIKIGKAFHANIYGYVAHDCVIGDYVTFGPRVMCNGNVHIGDHAYIGTGAILRQGTADQPLKIGEGAFVGMGAVVTRNVAPHTVVVGNPATILRKK